MLYQVGKKFNETNICNTTKIFEAMKRSEELILRKILYNQTSTKCIKPCHTSSYEISLRKVHKNAVFLSGQRELITNDKYGLVFIYEEFMVQTREEYLVMDEDTLVSTIGGFLGLFLGWSCLSIGEWICQSVKNCLK